MDGYEANLTSLGARFTYGCTSLEYVIIPSSVTDIGQEAFKGCSDLKVYFQTLELPSLGNVWPDASAKFHEVGEWELIDGVPTPTIDTSY